MVSEARFELAAFGSGGRYSPNELPAYVVFIDLNASISSDRHLTVAYKNKKGTQPNRLNPFLLVVPGTRIELVQSQGPRDFK